MNKKYLILSIVTLLFLVGCNRDDTFKYEKGKGAVEFTISSDIFSTKADAKNANINPDDFKIEIINKSGVIFKRWNKYSEYKAQENKKILINAGGPYTIRATYGDSTAMGFNAFYFKGEQTFTVVPQQTVTLSVVCKQANAEVAVVFGDNLKVEYPNYWAKVGKSISPSLLFEKETKESGYTMPSDLFLWLYVINDKSDTLYFKSKTPVTAAAGDSVTFNVDTKKTPTMEVNITVSINTDTDNKEINIPIGIYMLPKDAPTILPEGFDSNSGILSYTEGTKPSKAALNINAPSGIKKCVMTVTSPYLINSLDWPSQIDFLNIPTDIKSILIRDGLLWTNSMSGLKLANIDFSAVAKLIKFSDDPAANTNPITLEISDLLDKTIKATYKMVVTKSDISISNVNNFDIWSSSLSVKMTANLGDPALIYPEVKAEGASTWVKPSFTTSVEGNSSTISITGLNSGTNYFVRGRYYNNSSEGKSFTTESAAQVGNASFEEWRDGTRYNQPIYYPWTGEQWWDTNSNATMPESITAAYIDFKRFPTTWYTSDARTGSKAALTRSIAVNNANSLIGHWGNTQGKLFIGTADNSGNFSNAGHTFPSRPTKMEFYYKYLPQGTDEFSAIVEIKAGDVVIGTGTFKLSTGTAVSSYTKATADITYSDTSLKATSIYILFLSSTNSSPACKRQDVTIPAGVRNVYAGSALTIDDVTMIYGK